MTSEDNLLLARLNDCINSSQKKQFPSFIGFLTEHEASVALQYLNKQQTGNHKLYGGYPNAERCILGISHHNAEIEDYYYPVSGVSFSYKKEFVLTHRDFLGSFMSLGIKRETIGDILTGLGYSVAFIKDDIKDYLLSQITKIGNVGVTIEEWDGYTLPFVDNRKVLGCTVSSPRLDGVVSAVIPLSREKAASAIKQGLVFVNGIAVGNVSYTVKEQDKISVRGKGKFIVSEFSGTTKKGRLKLTVEKYI